jgi:diguanylate cyclase (GGDEF)-like protein
MALPSPPLPLRAQDNFMHALLGARDMQALAVVALQELERFGLQDIELVWNHQPSDPGQLHTARGQPLGAPQRALLDRARGHGGAADERLADGGVWRAQLLAQNAGFWAALVSRYAPGHAVSDWQEPLAALSLRAQSLLHTQRLQVDVERLANAERLQRALFAISDLASSDQSMADMLHGLHLIVGRLMYAENFYIARYDAGRDTLRFVYFADSHDTVIPDPDEEIPCSELGNSLTLAMIRHGKPLRGPSAQLRELHHVARDEALGPDSEDWLGVPLLEDGVVRGAVVVQSYDPAVRYGEDEQTLLNYVGQHILNALSRRDAQASLEQRVQERTRELRHEVQVREQSERLQRALFRIAEISGSSAGIDAFYASVHEIVGELLDARNFYIALLTEDGKELEFPYSVDERDTRLKRRLLGHGLSEYVLRTGRALLIDRAGVDTLEKAGEVRSTGSKSVCWLGVPLQIAGKVMGLIAVQSYTPDYLYSERDEELLSFVSLHIASALERRHADESLRQAYAELEQRVAARTSELADTNFELRKQISVRERIEYRLKHEALHDALTGLPNRSQLLATLGLALNRYRSEGGDDFAVLFLDLDRFKVVNDSVGHLVGDELLKEAARRIGRCVREPDTVARLGGDEFAIVIDRIQEAQDAVLVAERVIRSLAEPMRIAGKELYTSASIGIALANARYRNPEELLRDADVAMYRAKAAGRNAFALFDERLHQDALRQLELEGDLRRALQRREFVPFYQPIVRLADGHVSAYEALMRWQHPEHGLLSPAEYLTTAEESGLLEQIDWQIYEQVCRDLPRLIAGEGHVTINVSPRHLRALDFDRRLLVLLRDYNVDAARLRLEVTEGALLENPEQVRQCLTRLRDAGVHTLLDDFGTGYSSLSYLHRFPLHGLKVDRSFVTALRTGESGGSTAIVRAIRLLADSLGLEVIAEGVEAEEQRQHLRLLGLSAGQGYLFDRPQPLGQIISRRTTAA